MPSCLVCEGAIAPFMSFGPMPIANGFLTPEEFDREPFVDLSVAFCADCCMVQLTNLVDRARMFHDEYPFFSSTSSRMAAHFQRLAEQILAEHAASDNSFVVEIGSNDGILLQHVARRGIRHLGIEPSRNVARAATERGVRTVAEFFDGSLAERIVDQDGPADVIVGANVLCHIPYIHSVMEGVRMLLKPDGRLIFEDPYLGDIVEKGSYDQIYDEHALYFSASSVRHLVAQHGLELVDVAPQNVHGGSMRYTVARRGATPVSGSVERQLACERALGLHRPESYDGLRVRIERSRDELMALLRGLKQQGQRVVGYGATSKSTTVTNYCGITSELVEFISDTTPIKQGKFSPGTHIPVRPYGEFLADYPDYALLFAWNHAEEIFAKERPFLERGGRFILYVPRVHVTGADR